MLKSLNTASEEEFITNMKAAKRSCEQLLDHSDSDEDEMEQEEASERNYAKEKVQVLETLALFSWLTNAVDTTTGEYEHRGKGLVTLPRRGMAKQPRGKGVAVTPPEESYLYDEDTGLEWPVQFSMYSSLSNIQGPVDFTPEQWSASSASKPSLRQMLASSRGSCDSSPITISGPEESDPVYMTENTDEYCRHISSFVIVYYWHNCTGYCTKCLSLFIFFYNSFTFRLDGLGSVYMGCKGI
eukprot:g38118.t1